MSVASDTLLALGGAIGFRMVGGPGVIIYRGCSGWVVLSFLCRISSCVYYHTTPYPLLHPFPRRPLLIQPRFEVIPIPDRNHPAGGGVPIEALPGQRRGSHYRLWAEPERRDHPRRGRLDFAVQVGSRYPLPGEELEALLPNASADPGCAVGNGLPARVLWPDGFQGDAVRARAGSV